MKMRADFYHFSLSLSDREACLYKQPIINKLKLYYLYIPATFKFFIYNCVHQKVAGSLS